MKRQVIDVDVQDKMGFGVTYTVTLVEDEHATGVESIYRGPWPLLWPSDEWTAAALAALEKYRPDVYGTGATTVGSSVELDGDILTEDDPTGW